MSEQSNLDYFSVSRKNSDDSITIIHNNIAIKSINERYLFTDKPGLGDYIYFINCKFSDTIEPVPIAGGAISI